MSKRTRVTIVGALAVFALAAVLVGTALAAKTISETTKLAENQVVPGPGQKGASGTADIDVTKSKQKLCFDVSFKKVTPTPNSAEIHKGAKGDTGPKKVDLWTKSTSSPASGCIKKVAKPFLNKLGNHPENFYVQLHSTMFPKGAIRGQLKFAK